jgi:hypothetical protein
VMAWWEYLMPPFGSVGGVTGRGAAAGARCPESRVNHPARPVAVYLSTSQRDILS